MPQKGNPTFPIHFPCPGAPPCDNDLETPERPSADRAHQPPQTPPPATTRNHHSTEPYRLSLLVIVVVLPSQFDEPGLDLLFNCILPRDPAVSDQQVRQTDPAHFAPELHRGQRPHTTLSPSDRISTGRVCRPSRCTARTRPGASCFAQTLSVTSEVLPSSPLAVSSGCWAAPGDDLRKSRTSRGALGGRLVSPNRTRRRSAPVRPFQKQGRLLHAPGSQPKSPVTTRFRKVRVYEYPYACASPLPL